MRRFLIAVLSAVLLLTGCAKENDKREDNKEKTRTKAVQKQKENISKQEAVTLPEESESKPVVASGVSSLYTDEELLTYANDHFDDYWHTYYCFMAGTYFEGSGDWGTPLVINDPNIHSLQDIENVWYQKFSRRYPVSYMDMTINRYNEVPFWEENGQVYERYHIDGFVGVSFYFDHIVQKSNDEVWFELYCKGVDGNENGRLMYGTVVRND